MARAAVLGRLTWQVATVHALLEESSTARTITLDVEGWAGHVARQHVDLPLTAPDGYTATRSCSIASAAVETGRADAGPRGRIDVTVGRVPDGEVSGYLAGELRVGDQVEVRGPLGGWFVWRPEQAEPVQLVAGGVGLVPLM